MCAEAHDKRAFYVQCMQIEEAPLCTDGDPMPGSACGAERREGGEDRGVLVKGGEGRGGRSVSGTECHHCVWWGMGHGKGEPSRPGPTRFGWEEGLQALLRGYRNVQPDSRMAQTSNKWIGGQTLLASNRLLKSVFDFGRFGKRGSSLTM